MKLDNKLLGIILIILLALLFLYMAGFSPKSYPLSILRKPT